MENVVEMPVNRGVMPKTEPIEAITYDDEDKDELQISIESARSETESDKPYQHVRIPEIRRGGSRIIMAISGICGAAAGAAMMFTGKSAEIPLGTFGEIFLGGLITGAIMLAAEFLLGFFAFGDWLVWILPLCCGMGCALRICSAATWIEFIGAALRLVGVIFGAARSADFSQLLFKLSCGGAVYMEFSPRRSFALSLLRYLMMITAGTLVEACSAIVAA